MVLITFQRKPLRSVKFRFSPFFRVVVPDHFFGAAVTLVPPVRTAGPFGTVGPVGGLFCGNCLIACRSSAMSFCNCSSCAAVFGSVRPEHPARTVAPITARNVFQRMFFLQR